MRDVPCKSSSAKLFRSASCCSRIRSRRRSWVQDVAPLIEIGKTQQADTITEKQIDNLPINERNFLNFSLLTPGVTDARALISFSLPQAPTSGLSFAGQSGRANNVTIDGVDNNDSAVAAVRSTLSQEAVQEFQINRSNFSAEFGRAGGGLINIVSKSGSNHFGGTVFAFLRDQSWMQEMHLRSARMAAESIRRMIGFSPVSLWAARSRRIEHLPFFPTKAMSQRESRFVTFLENTDFFQPTASQRELIQGLRDNSSSALQSLSSMLNASLTTSRQLFPATVALLESNSGVFPYRNNENTASLRLDHSASRSNQLFARLSFSDADAIGGGIGGLKARSRGVNYGIQDYAGVLGDAHFVGPKLVNEFRFQFADRDYRALPADATRAGDYDQRHRCVGPRLVSPVEDETKSGGSGWTM